MLTLGIDSKSDNTAAAPSIRAIRLENAAREFEAQMMKELLQPLAQKDQLFSDGEEDSSVLGQFAAESLAKGISQQGGIGIANGLIQAFSRFEANASDGKVTRQGYDNLSVGDHK